MTKATSTSQTAFDDPGDFDEADNHVKQRRRQLATDEESYKANDLHTEQGADTEPDTQGSEPNGAQGATTMNSTHPYNLCQQLVDAIIDFRTTIKDQPYMGGRNLYHLLVPSCLQWFL